ncbi:Tetratricopeptide repeat-containing protein [Tenacibaculum mesophilum]|uniref:histidine kinase n=1 Tax=Tenacibaculum mesophilum TaxID=104268 RepID=A0ABN5T7M5_9FLAO|nr:tetratricopeptide repeat-containing sensor histidine kinase [Tenacibaculum mesophilum]AZJ32435.1 tetratricopeptide repeat protein [Tenacibaculum mesophilum]QFS27689.1 histidine kinase [Tenacibaculum mesophilum]BFF36734.1 ATP-binding protein [Tenacibaculum mesophilum]SHG15066.1 Tetratricopeptide repeat-containing protein [Tenacibaculum mesophilum]
MDFRKNIFSLFFIILPALYIKAGTCNYFVYFQENKPSNENSRYDSALKLYNNEEYSKALEQLLDLSQSVSGKNLEMEYKCLFLIGNIFKKRNNHEKALNFFNQSLKILTKKSLIDSNDYNKFPNDTTLANTYLRIGVQYSILGIRDSSKLYYRKITELDPLNKNLTYIKGKAYNNLSATYIQESNYELAKEYIKKSIEIHRQNNKRLSESKALTNLANIILNEKKYELAKKTYFEAINIIRNDSSLDAIKHKQDIYYNIAWALYLLKDYKAYEYQEKSYIIKDTLTDREMRRIVKGVFEKHKVDLEKQKVNLVEEQRKLEEAQEAKTSMLFGALSFLVLIVSGVIIYNYKLRQKNLRLKLSESKLIQQQNLEKVRSEAQIKILNATIDGKETERKLIAEILHDNVSALLSSANMHLTATKKQFNGGTPQEIEKTQAIISEASQKVRDLSHNLVSSILLKFGLEYAIKDVVKKYSNSQLKLEVSAKNINRYNQEFEIKIFNVIQELINNILKHSKAKHAQIDLKEEKNQLTVLVKDDGVGFSTSSSSFSDGIGLNQVEARVHMMDGKLTIKSQINVGTTIQIIVPILRKENNFNKLTSVS